MTCYSYGMTEQQFNDGSGQYISLFIQGHAKRELERHKDGWAQARFIASTMSKEAAKHRFWWEKKKIQKVNLPPGFWDKFTPDFNGRELNAFEAKELLN